MPKKMKTTYGWIAYMLNEKELLKLLEFHCFGNICDSCGKHLKEVGVYIPILNHCMCEQCFVKWEKANRYHECDAKYELQNIKWLESWLAYLGMDINSIQGVSNERY